MADYNPTGRTRDERERLHSNGIRDRYIEGPKKPITKIPGRITTNTPAVFDNNVAEITSGLFNLLIKKHADYGPKNISQSPGGPLNGLRVRMWDKIARINNLIDSGVKPENESLIDSYRDLANYSIIAIMVLEGKWPAE